MNNNLKVNNVNFGFNLKLKDIPKVPGINAKEIKIADLKHLSPKKGLIAILDCDVFEYETKRFGKHGILIKDGKFKAIDECDSEILDGLVSYVSGEGYSVTPLFLDGHTHGGFGVSFHTDEESKIRYCLKELKARGVGAIVATLMPGKLEHINKRIGVLTNIIENPLPDEAIIIGIHGEGPFLNPNPRTNGIHNVEDLLNPTVDNFKIMWGGNKYFRKLTYAPELEDKHHKLTEFLLMNNIIPSAGHTMARAEDLHPGITNVTHYGNSMLPLEFRKNLTLANVALFDERYTVEMIAEKTHLNPNMRNLIINYKTGDSLMLVSDSLSQAGKRENFKLGGKDIFVDENGIPRDSKGTLAGSLKFVPDLVSELLQTTKMTFADIVRCASYNPAKNYGVEKELAIKAGNEARFSIWDNATNSHVITM